MEECQQPDVEEQGSEPAASLAGSRNSKVASWLEQKAREGEMELMSKRCCSLGEDVGDGL